MRFTLVLPLSTAVVASIVLALPTPEPTAVAPTTTDQLVVVASSPSHAVAAASPAGPGHPSRRPAPASTRDPVLGAHPLWVWPLSPRPVVLRPFVRPATTYGPGHRGIDLAGSGGQAVVAVAAGIVTHVGQIGGRGTVSVLHPSGVRSTYEPVDALVQEGQTVAHGVQLGRLAEHGSHCAATCLHLGAVRGETYLDPLVFFAGARPVRLLPLDQAPDG